MADSMLVSTRRMAGALAVMGFAIGACSKGGTSPAPAPAPAAARPASQAVTTAVTPPAPAASLYDDAQATRGEGVYNKNCASCHEKIEYTGAQFKAKWNGRAAFELFDLIRTTMPDDGPGKLPAQEYADIVGYMMKLNGVRPGPTALPTDAAALKAIKIQLP